MPSRLLFPLHVKCGLSPYWSIDPGLALSGGFEPQHFCAVKPATASILHEPHDLDHSKSPWQSAACKQRVDAPIRVHESFSCSTSRLLLHTSTPLSSRCSPSNRSKPLHKEVSIEALRSLRHLPASACSGEALHLWQVSDDPAERLLAIVNLSAQAPGNDSIAA